MRLLRAVLDKRIFFNLLFFVLLLGGVLAYRSIPVDVYPDVPLNQATVTTVWPGASAKEVEVLLTQRLEDQILTLQELTKVRSRSQRNRSRILVKFNNNLSPQEYQNRLQDLRGAVARVDGLPAEADQPKVTSMTTWELWPLCKIVISGGKKGRVFDPAEEFQARQVARALLPVLRQVDGVQKVSESFREPEVHINVRQDRLWDLGYTLTEVAERLRHLNRDFAAGQLNLSTGQFVLNTKGGQDDPSQLEELVLFERPGATPILLGDLADVTVDFEEAFIYERFNGSPALTVSIVKEGPADSVEVVEALQACLEAYRAEHPPPDGMKLELVMDSSQIIRSRISVLVNNLFGGIIFVGILLWLSLGARNALLALLGIPFSVLCAFILFEPLGLTLNAISLFSLVLVSGMVVDDAIIVLEAIYQRVESGLPIHEAVVEGTSEVLAPVFTSTLTTVCAFLPMLMMDGVMGQYFSVIPKTVVVTLAASLLECFFILPIHYLDWGPRAERAQQPEGEPQPKPDGLLHRMAKWVARINAAFIRKPWGMVVAGVLLCGLAAAFASRIPVQLFPSDFQIYAVTCQLPEGSTLDQSSDVAAYIEKELQQQVESGEVQYFVSTAGMAWSADNQLIMASDLLQVMVFMHDDEAHPERLLIKTQQIVQAAMEKPGAPEYRRLTVAAPNDGPPTGKPIQMRILVGDYAQGERLALRTESFLKSIEGVHSVERDIDRGPMRLDLSLREEAKALDGVDEGAVGQIFQSSNIGVRVGTFKDPKYGEAYDSKVILAPEDRANLERLIAGPVRQPRSRELLPLSLFGRLRSRSSFQARPHFGGRRCVTVTADVDPDLTTSGAVNGLLTEWLEASGLAKSSLGVRLGGEFEETSKSFDSMTRAFYVVLLLIYIILATQFRSYGQPFIVLVSVPFSFVGVVFGLLAMGIPFTITSFVATIGLAGVVVNDVIVLVALVNNLRAQGLDPDASIVEGIRLRFRPILMTTLTTVIGLLPMAIGLGGFSKIWSPFAATMCFGLMSAFALIMLVVPSLIKVVDTITGQAGANPAETNIPA